MGKLANKSKTDAREHRFGEYPRSTSRIKLTNAETQMNADTTHPIAVKTYVEVETGECPSADAIPRAMGAVAKLTTAIVRLLR